MIPKAKRLIAQIVLVYKLLNMYHHMHHDMEALNTVMLIQSTLLKNFPTHPRCTAG